jgi:two-component system sensor histidine kinase UhpB
VLVAACIVLIVEPANGRVVALVGGLAVMLVVNAVLMRRAFAPLARLTALMEAVDPLAPGRRIPPLGPESEVTTLAQAFNAMLDRLESERRDSARRALAAQEEERRHLAAELHDEIGQTLTALIMQLDRLARRTTGDLQAELAEAVATSRASLDDVRALARRLRPEVLDELGLVPFAPASCSPTTTRSSARACGASSKTSPTWRSSPRPATARRRWRSPCRPTSTWPSSTSRCRR